MDRYEEGLRCQDVTLGLRTVDSDSSALLPMKTTRTIGMAADLAGLIKGRNVITEIDALRTVASETLDIGAFALEPALLTLEQAALIDIDRDSHGEISRITEQIPVFRDLYEDLGDAWHGGNPRQVEQSLVSVVNRLASGPMPTEGLYDEIGLGKADADEVYKIGRSTTLFKTIPTSDGEILYSPFTAFEDPARMSEVLIEHGPGQLAEALHRVHSYQGLPVGPETDPALADAVALGLVSAPSVQIPSGTMRAFASMPYTLDRELLTIRKMVLDKALAIVACIRCGQHYGGATNSREAIAVLGSLVATGELSEHGSHERQYKLLRDQGVVRFLPDSKSWGSWKRVGFIDTPENREAMAVARTLLEGSELTEGREQRPDVQKLLDLDARALKPLQTVRKMERTRVVDEAGLGRAFEQLMGRGSRQ